MTANDFSRHAFPPQGWMFRQPQTNWSNPMALVGFGASVDAIRKHRLANPAITAKFNLKTDPTAVEDELEAFTRARLGIPLVAPSFFQQSSSRLSPRVFAAAADIKRAAQGTAVVLDWLTSGGAPVAKDLAEKRAGICTGGDNWVDDKGVKQTRCRKNVEGSWYTVAPAELIRSTLSARSDLKLETSRDGALKSCDVCKCLMRLKVWTPLDFILGKTKPEIVAEFPAHCWIKNHDGAV
jgi:hypothetical protein